MSTDRTPAFPPSLSERELEVLRLVATGATNSQVARDLSISVNTVKVHLNNIFSKLGVQSRTEASLYAVRHGWVEVKWADGLASNGARLPAPAAEEANPAVLEPAPDDTSAQTIPVPANDTPEAVSTPGPPAVAENTLPRQRWALLAAGILLLAAAAFILFVFMPGTPFGKSLFSQSPAAVAPPVANSTPLPRWQLRAPLASPRDAIAVTTLNGRIYAIGGLSADGVVSTVEVYDPPSDRWAPGHSLLAPVQGAGAAIIGGRLYVPGGCNAQDQPSSMMQVYDPQRDAWDAGVALPVALCHYALAALEGKLYLFGGWNGSAAVADVRVFDPVRGEWNMHAPLPGPRMGASAAVVDDRIYVAGGRDGTKLLDQLLMFDPTQPPSSATAWVQRASLDHPRAHLALAALAGNLYAVGGGWSEALAQNARFDTRANSLQVMEEDPEALWRVGGVAALETKVYIVGGWKGSPTASLAEYTALYRFFLPNAPGSP